MRRKKVERPEAAKEKIHCKNEFELCYLRHQYFRRVKYNPTEREMEPFKKIAVHLAKNTFFTYKNLFSIIGFESEDLFNIAYVHLVSFLGLFSLESTPDKYKDFVTHFKEIQEKEPEEEDILDKNKANFTLFLKQRMEDVVRICRQKARNIKGLPAEEFYYYFGPKSPPKIRRELLKNHERFGYRKLDNAIYKSIKKKAGRITGNVFFFNDNYYVAVPIEKKLLNIDDLNGAGLNPYDNMHNMTPEDVYFSSEDTEVWKERQEAFDNKSTHSKSYIISNFIRKNRNKRQFREEIRVAKRLLKELR